MYIVFTHIFCVYKSSIKINFMVGKKGPFVVSSDVIDSIVARKTIDRGFDEKVRREAGRHRREGQTRDGVKYNIILLNCHRKSFINLFFIN